MNDAQFEREREYQTGEREYPLTKGKMPLSFITGNIEDVDTYVEQIHVAGKVDESCDTLEEYNS